MFVILALVSGSRTALLGITFCLLLQIIFGLKGKRSYKKNQIYIVLGIMLVGFVIYIVNRKVADAQIERIANIINTLERVASESSGGIHLRYITSVPEVTRMNGILHNLIGYGASCSGYVFSHFYNQYTTIGIWAVECDYVNYLWNFGYLGFAVYYFWYGKNALKCCRMDNRYYLLFLGLLFEGFFYNVTFNWVNLLIVSIFILGQKNINIFQPNNYLENAYVKENK
jgi:hypothetical protein